MIKIKFLNLDYESNDLDYHAEKTLKIFKKLIGLQVLRLNSGWTGKSLFDFCALLKSVEIYAHPHGLSYGLRDLMDLQIISLQPDPRFYPLP